MTVVMRCLSLGLILVLAACAPPRAVRPDLAVVPAARYPASVPEAQRVEGEALPQDPSWRIEGARPLDPTTRSGPSRNFSLAFDQAPISVVVDALIGQTLRRSYRIDPSVQGDLTLSIQGRMTETQALMLLDRALGGVNGALVMEGVGYAVVPRAQAGRLGGTPQVVGDGIDGLATSVVYQARSLGVTELVRLLEPLAGEGAVVRADPARQQLYISGDATTVSALARTARALDVDWMQGRSFQLIPVRFASPAQIISEVRQVLGGPDGPTGGQIELVEMDRLNAVLVIARSPEGLDRALDWIARFDVPPPPAARRLRTISLANLEAEQLVETLSALLGSGGGATAASSGSTAAASATPDTPAPAQAPGSGGDGLRITADPRTNSIVMLADDAEYRNVLNIVRELDVPPPQVLIEATIAEVTLNDRLRFGVQWFIEQDNLAGGFLGGDGTSPSLSFPGLSFRYLDVNVEAVLSALSSVTDVQLVSTPRILVLSNESAELQVGDQVPILVQSAVGLDTDSRILNTVQYRDTGVVLSVTPRVSDSGRMFITIELEVSEVAGTTSSDIDSPTIQQRRLSTRIQVEDGQLVVIGGLIRSSTSIGDTGIPYLSRIPVAGALFRSRDQTQRQTELVMFLRPVVIRSRSDIDRVTDELVFRLQALGLPVETPQS